MSARAGKGSGRARVGDEIACQCDLLFVLARFENHRAGLDEDRW